MTPPGELLQRGRRFLGRLGQSVATMRADRHPEGALTITAAVMSHVGRVREANEDHSIVVEFAGEAVHRRAIGGEAWTGAPPALLLVADGMGGEAAGEVASEMAATLIASQLAGAWSRDSAGSNRRQQSLVEAIGFANRAIHFFADGADHRKGMGTTVTAAAVCGGDLYVGHVGDSRAYLLRDGDTRRLTKDHSLVQHLLDTGGLTVEEAADDPRRNVLVRALGPCADVAVDVCCERLRAGDVLMLCSDGLWSAVTDEEVIDTLRETADLPAMCESLVALANSRGGVDNVTVLIARFEGPSARPAVN